MSLLIIFGHWLDFYQMVFPAVSPNKVPMILYDFGVALGFVGLIMFVTGRALSKAPLLAKNHPFLKESMIHHTYLLKACVGGRKQVNIELGFKQEIRITLTENYFES